MCKLCNLQISHTHIHIAQEENICYILFTNFKILFIAQKKDLSQICLKSMRIFLQTRTSFMTQTIKLRYALYMYHTYTIEHMLHIYEFF